MDTTNTRDEIRGLAQQRKYTEALALCSDALAEHPESLELFEERALVRALLKDWHGATDDITEVIRRCPAPDPHHYFNRARWNLDAGSYDDAIVDCTSVVDIETSLKRSYYSGASYFLRAIAKLQLGDHQGALDDCRQVADDAVFWARGKLQSKKALVDELTKRLGRSEP